MILLLALSTFVLVGGALGFYLFKGRDSWDISEFLVLFLLWMLGIGIGVEVCPQRWKEIATPFGLFLGGSGVLSFVFFRCSLRSLGIRRFPLQFTPWIVLVAMIQIMVSTLWVLLCTYFVGTIEKQEFVQEFLTSSPYERWAFTFVIIAWAPIVEEVLMRGFLWEAIKRSTTEKIIISGILFGMLHIDNMYSVLPLCVFGCMLGVLRERSGSLWAPMLAHFLNNSIVLINIA
ncbi:MAG: hypothetical protein CL916_04515 [Deltaproteobacteria bacterium]|nr:hypothetical protein [Deltaproteobacteria bacterium]